MKEWIQGSSHVEFWKSRLQLNKTTSYTILAFSAHTEFLGYWFKTAPFAQAATAPSAAGKENESPGAATCIGNQRELMHCFLQGSLVSELDTVSGLEGCERTSGSRLLQNTLD
jgi:hypothetical protein